MLVFSTNLEPESLDEEAFFRRIPCKIEMKGPSESQFAQLLAGFDQTPECANYLIQTLKRTGRSLKYCYVSDILEQCAEFCEFHGHERVLTPPMIDLAMHNYFARR